MEDQPVEWMWREFIRKTEIDVEIIRGLSFESAELAAQYVQTGAGVALLDRDMFQRELSDGTLVMPFEVAIEIGFGYYLAVDPAALDRPITRSFRRWVTEWFIRRARHDAGSSATANSVQ